MDKIEYKIYQYNSFNDDISTLEALLSTIHNDPTHTFISMNDTILQSGAYVVIVHYQIEASEKETPKRMETGADL